MYKGSYKVIVVVVGLGVLEGCILDRSVWTKMESGIMGLGEAAKPVICSSRQGPQDGWKPCARLGPQARCSMVRAEY